MKTTRGIPVIIALSVLSSFARAQDGTLDLSFGSAGVVQTVAGHAANALLIQPDGKLIVAGTINKSTMDMAVARYHSNGSLDSTFGVDGIASYDFNQKADQAFCAVLQSDGKIIVAGSAGQTGSSNNDDLAAIRLNPDGSLDSGFAVNGRYQHDVGGYAYESVYHMALQPDGKILLVGKAGTDMFAKNAVIRLNSNGTPDASFDGDGILNAFSFGLYVLSELHSIAVQADSKILIAGSSNNNLAISRLNSNGSLDTGFGNNGFLALPQMSTRSRMAIQQDGKIVISSAHATQTTATLFRIMASGTPDSTFGVNGRTAVQVGTPGTYDFLNDLIIQADGKIIATGSSYTSSTQSDFLIIRFLPDGTTDSSFGASSNGIVTISLANTDEDRGMAIKLQADGKIVVAGSPCTGSCDFALLRLHNSVSGVSVEGETALIQAPLVYPNPADAILSIDRIQPGAEVSIFDINGKLVYKATALYRKYTLNVTDFNEGIYFVRLLNDGSNINRRIVIVH